MLHYLATHANIVGQDIGERMKDIIVMCPTVERATKEFKKFCEKNDRYIEKAFKFQVTLINGVNIFFIGSTESLRGKRANIINIDGFTLEI